MDSQQVIIVGCGYTGRRVASRLLDAGVQVTATTRDPFALRDVAARGTRIVALDVTLPDALDKLRRAISPGASALLSIPTLRNPRGLFDPTPQIVEALGDRPSRVVYLSTTGVYGSAQKVDATTPAAPATERQRLRMAAEEAVRRGPWPSLVLRPAAIYGPGRGVHVAMREGRFTLLGEGANFVSRIHVDDLAVHAEKALLGDLTGAFPVADEEPCTSREIAEFCAKLLNLPMPQSAQVQEVSETRRSDRRVDGGAIRRALGIELLYPSYRQGIPAALAEERQGEA